MTVAKSQIHTYHDLIGLTNEQVYMFVARNDRRLLQPHLKMVPSMLFVSLGFDSRYLRDTG